jgi:hypothetical protein
LITRINGWREHIVVANIIVNRAIKTGKIFYMLSLRNKRPFKPKNSFWIKLLPWRKSTFEDQLEKSSCDSYNNSTVILWYWRCNQPNNGQKMSYARLFFLTSPFWYLHQCIWCFDWSLLIWKKCFHWTCSFNLNLKKKKFLFAEVHSQNYLKIS